MSARGDKNHVEELKPYLYTTFNFPKEILNQPGVFVPISAGGKSPLLEPYGARQLVDFLGSLHHPSLVVVVDSLNLHNIIAMERMKEHSEMCPAKARRKALENGNLYMEAISNAIKENKNVADEEKVTLIRWEDVIDGGKIKQEQIVHEYYNKSKIFRERIDELARDYLIRRNQSRRYPSRRLRHLANFILGELPSFITGFSYKGHRYQTQVYATSAKFLANLVPKERGYVCPRSVWSLMHDIRTQSIFGDLKKELVEAVDGVETYYEVAILPIVSKSE